MKILLEHDVTRAMPRRHGCYAQRSEGKGVLIGSDTILSITHVVLSSVDRGVYR